jgi:hypothetical protein
VGGGEQEEEDHFYKILAPPPPPTTTMQKVNDDDDSDFDLAAAQLAAAADAETKVAASLVFRVAPAAAAHSEMLQAFHKYQLDDGIPADEAQSVTAVVQHYILFAQKEKQQQKEEDAPTATAPNPDPNRVQASVLDNLILDTTLYSKWLNSGTLGQRRSATKGAYINRFQKFLRWRISHCLGDLLDISLATVRSGTERVLAELGIMGAKENKKTKEDQKQRLCRDALEERGEWASVQDLLGAVNEGEQVYSALISKARASGGMSPGDRSWATQFVLSAVSVLLAPSRVGFWEHLTLEQLDKAIASEEHILSSTKFKNAAHYGYKSVVLTDRVRAILQDYRTFVRPYCVSPNNVVRQVDSSPGAPVFLNAQSGGCLTKMSAKVSSRV